jgi:hypothetical protein
MAIFSIPKIIKIVFAEIMGNVGKPDGYPSFSTKRHCPQLEIPATILPLESKTVS